MHAAANGLTWLASNLAERGPALLVVDDVHWADAPSLRWLAGLARRLDELCLGVLCAVRSGEPAEDGDLLAELLAAAPDPPLRPRALGPAAAEALVRERLPTAASGFAHACHAVTAGNPFLLRALLDHLMRERVEPTDEVAARLSAFGPEQVARGVERQLARLPDGATALARALAVLGGAAPLRHAARLAGLDHASAARLADALRMAGLLDDGPEPALAHPLVAGALYASLPSGERALAHRQAAAVLAAEHEDPERVALHLLRTEPAADPGTLAALRLAAARASARGDPESATAFLRRALAEPPLDPADEADVRLALGLALAARVHPDARELLHEAVALAASPEQHTEIALRGAREMSLAGLFDDAIALARRGLEAPAGPPPEAVARLEAELVCSAWLHAATKPEAHARLRRPAVSPPPLELWRGNAAWEATIAGAPAARALELLRPLLGGPLDAEADTLLATGATLVLLFNEELDAACARCAAVIDHARPRGWLIALAHGAYLRAMALLRAGRVRDAAPDARLAFEFKLVHSPIAALLWSLQAYVDPLVELDDLDAAEAALAAAGALEDVPEGAFGAPMVLQPRARLRLAQRRSAAALADLEAAAARWDELGVRHAWMASWRVDAAEALVTLGDTHGARRLAEEHIALAERLGTAGPLGAGLRALAGTAGRRERVALLERAVAILDGSPARLEHTRALVDLGAALRRANRRADARGPLRAALDRAERDGMGLLARRARDELKATGARPRRNALSGPAALTPAEHRVAVLAARGHGNREIAEQLYVTRRTVETHLTHAFQKLDVTRRDQLRARLAAREPALPA